VSSDSPRWSPRDSDAEVGAELLSESDIHRRVRALGAAITADYVGRQPLLVGVLRGAVIFLSDLVRAIELPTEIDFLAVSSYGESTTSSGVVRIVKDLETELSGRDVILVEDIIDSGLTLRFLLANLHARGPASVAVAALIVRELIDVPPEVRYQGFTLPPTWVVGYGLDAGQRNRHLRAIHAYVPPAAAE
jgi:hypoxanthine phosphoribosyltransferase